MPSFTELLNSSTLAAFIRLSLLIFAMAGGIVGTIVTQNVNSILDKATRTENEVLSLTSATDKAEANADAASVAVQSARIETNRRFDDLERTLQEQNIRLNENSLKVYRAEIRIGCLEHKIICPSL